TKQFLRHDKEDPHAHIRYFNKITSTNDVPNVPIAIRLSLCFSPILSIEKNQASAPAPAPAPVKAVELSCDYCGGDILTKKTQVHTWATLIWDNNSEYVSQAAAANYNQVRAPISDRQCLSNHIRPPGVPPFRHSQANNANNFNRGNNFNQNRESNFNQNRGGNFNQSNFSQNQLHRPQVNQSPAYQAPVPQTHSVTKNDFDNYVMANEAIMRNKQITSKTSVRRQTETPN
ncbi:hypothetical protein Tco_0717623, partial [Tanacetum coccineum]